MNTKLPKKLLDVPLSSEGLESPLGYARTITRRGNPTDAERLRERELDAEPFEFVEGGRWKSPVRYD